MNKRNQDKELEDYVHQRHSIKQGEHYFLTILDDNGLQTVNLSSFEKNKITFGKGFNNDIVLSSGLIDLNQGYFEINEYGVLAVNTSLQALMTGYNNKVFENVYLQEAGFIKYTDKNSPNSSGVLMVMSINKNLDEWKAFPLLGGNVTIGSSASCDIILTPNGVSKKHATIHKLSTKLTISDEFTINGTYINGSKISNSQETVLNNLDIILIGNSKLILSNSTLYYQVFERGIRLEAYDIVKNVKIKFKHKQISSHVNMVINPSEFVAFVGGSGAGKSTFMKCISGVIPPSSGTVLLNGENLFENYESLKYNIGYVPQDDIVYSNLTLHDMLHYAAKLRMPDNATSEERTARIKEVLEIVELSEFENSFIRQLSGGQRKRASIAVELIADPNLFFLDEPTSGLDPGTERSIMHTLREMSQIGKTIILVTHNTLNLHLCDKVAFFGAGGHLCFYGKPKEALEFFGVNDFVDIYTLINENMQYWLEKFQETYPQPKQPETDNRESNNIIGKKKSFLKQLVILIHRYIKLISNNIQQLLILFAQAPIIAIAFSLVVPSDIYTSYESTKNILFSLACASIWLGLLNSIQEICKEKVILQKEYMADLKLSAYLLSKFIVQTILAFIQSWLLIFVFQKIVGKSSESILISPFWDIQLICFLTILSASSLGLFISSLVKNADIAMTIVPIILIPQLLFSGILFELKGFTKFLSNFILSRWALEGLGTSTNLNGLTHLIHTITPMIKLKPEAYYIFTIEHMYQAIGVILLMTLVLLIGCYIVLRKNINKNL